MRFAILLSLGGLALVSCSSPDPVRPSSATTAPSNAATTSSVSPSGSPFTGPPTPEASFGFNGVVSGFPTGKVFLSGGGAYDLDHTGFVKSSGGFSCLEDVRQGPLSISINPSDPGPCLAGQGVRWDTAALIPSTMFRCTGAVSEALKPAVTTSTRVVLQADFYRAGNGGNESFTAQMIVSATDIAPEIPGVQNLWVQGVGCGEAIVNFRGAH